MPIYNLIEYSGNYSKTSKFKQYCRDETAIIDANGETVGFNVANAITDSFNFTQKNNVQNRQQSQKKCGYKSAIKIPSNFSGTLKIRFKKKQ